MKEVHQAPEESSTKGYRTEWSSNWLLNGFINVLYMYYKMDVLY